MPAAVAIPAAVSLVGTAASAIGQHKAASDAKAADAARLARVQGTMDQNYASNQAYQSQMQPTIAQMLGLALSPQQSQYTQFGSSSGESTQSSDFGAANPQREQVRQMVANEPYEVNTNLANQRAAAYRNAAQQRTAIGTKLGNAAARMGVNPQLMSIGADRGVNADLMNTDTGLQQQALENRRMAAGDITNMLNSLYRTTTTKQQQQTRGGGSQMGPANIGGALAALQAGAPVQREVAV